MKVEAITESITVSIRKVFLDGKSLNRSLFHQLIEEEAYGENWKFIGKRVLGYVKEGKDWYVVFVSTDDHLRKCKLDPFMLNYDGGVRYKVFGDKAELTANSAKVKEGVKQLQIFV